MKKLQNQTEINDYCFDLILNLFAKGNWSEDSSSLSVNTYKRFYLFLFKNLTETQQEAVIDQIATFNVSKDLIEHNIDGYNYKFSCLKTLIVNNVLLIKIKL